MWVENRGAGTLTINNNPKDQSAMQLRYQVAVMQKGRIEEAGRRFGASAPGNTVLEELGFTAERVAEVARRVVRDGLRGRHPRSVRDRRVPGRRIRIKHHIRPRRGQCDVAGRTAARASGHQQPRQWNRIWS